jgi:hypothetical protein
VRCRQQVRVCSIRDAVLRRGAGALGGGGRTAIRSEAPRCVEEEIGAEPDGGGGASNSISRSADSDALRSGAGRATLGAIGVDDGPCKKIAGTIDEMNEAGSAPDAVGAARARCGSAAS